MKKITFLNFHPAFYPPGSGGELRYWHVATQLARAFDVRMFNPTYGDSEWEVIEHAPHCHEERFPKTKAYDAWHRFFDRVARFGECSALVSSLAVRHHRAYLEAARTSAAQADILIHSSPFMAAAWPRKQGHQLFIYDSYNVEARLAEDNFGYGFWGRRAIGHVKRIEGGLARAADLIFVCSPEDGDEMADRYGIGYERIALVPNGVDTKALRPPTRDEREVARKRLGWENEAPRLLFLGSYHPPNILAARFLVDEVAASVPEAEFVIVGKVCEALADASVPKNVTLMGRVDDEMKLRLLQACDMALNPMFTGSGTNLKMLEFLAVGMPIITTPVGARGLSLGHSCEAMVVGREKFAQCVRDMLPDLERRRLLAREGRRHAEQQFEWEAIGERVRELLLHRTRKRMLFLNDYPVSPVNSGGKVRLEALARATAERGMPVTTLTLTKEERGRSVMHSSNWEEINVPRPAFQNRLDQFFHLTLGVGTDDVTSLLCASRARNYRRLLAEHLGDAHALVLNHCYMAGHLRDASGKPVVYESHNNEAKLKQALLTNSRVGRFLREQVRRAEDQLLRNAELVSCVSGEDADGFAKRGRPRGRIVMAPNGVDCAAYTVPRFDLRGKLRAEVGLSADRPALLFLGSGHPPNRDAAEFLMERVAPELPEADIVIVGSVCGWFHGTRTPSNVLLAGIVTEHVRNFLLTSCDLGLNPAFEGSGTSLKIPEYMAAGMGVVSSPVGARGFDGSEGMAVAPHDEFASTLAELIGDGAKLVELGNEARARALREFDWSACLADLLDQFQALAK